MTSSQARKMVLVSAAALATITVYRKQVDYQRYWGVGALTLMLSLAADFAPGIAGPFAVLVVLGDLTNKGVPTFLSKVSGGKYTASGVPVGANVNPATNPKAAGPTPTRSTQPYPSNLFAIGGLGK